MSLLFYASSCTQDKTEIDCFTESIILLDSGMADDFVSINRTPTDGETVLVWTANPPVFQIHHLDSRRVVRLAVPTISKNGVIGVDIVEEGKNRGIFLLSRDGKSIARLTLSGEFIENIILPEFIDSDSTRYIVCDPFIVMDDGILAIVGADTEPSEFANGWCLAKLGFESATWTPIRKHPRHVQKNPAYSMYYPLLDVVDRTKGEYLLKFRQDDTIFLMRNSEELNVTTVARIDTSRFAPLTDFMNARSATYYELTTPMYNSVHYLKKTKTTVATFLPEQPLRHPNGRFSSPIHRRMDIHSLFNLTVQKSIRMDSNCLAFRPFPFGDETSLWFAERVTNSGEHDTLFIVRYSSNHLLGICEHY
ncbi:MAG: hypothetical protein HYX66_01740 [Ignavibacteria bacterium]|nr:hypothetical protein [Ignavibacteria bacterium]